MFSTKITIKLRNLQNYALSLVSYKKIRVFRKHPFLERLCTMASISSVEKDSIATTQNSFKNCILAR